MRVDFQQVVSQMANVDRFQNISTVQVAESIRHSQNVAEQKEAQKKSESVADLSESGKVDEVKDESRKRKALLTRGGKREEGEESEDEGKGESGGYKEGENQGEKESSLKQPKIDIRV